MGLLFGSVLLRFRRDIRLRMYTGNGKGISFESLNYPSIIIPDLKAHKPRII